MSKEIRVALLAIVAIALVYWGYNFILGNNVMKQTAFYKVEYKNVGGLKTSTPVRVNGVQVGRVATVKNQMDEQNVLVELDLEPGLRIPKDTRAYILNETFMGQQAVELKYDTPCSGNDCAQPGDYLQGENLSVLASTVDRQELEVYLNEFENTILSLLDSIQDRTLGSDAEGPLANTIRDMESTMNNLKGATGQLNSLLYQSKDNITGTLENAETVTASLADNNERIERILVSTDSFTQQLSAVELKKTVDELSQTIASLKSTINKADQTFAGINSVVGGLENGEGTLGLLLQDPALYHELSTLSAKADSLLNDIQDRPYRYVPLKGRKRVKRYDRKDEQLEENNE